MRRLDDLVRQGKVVYVGVSDTPAWEVSRANTLADLRGWAPFVALQIRYSLIDRTAERDLLPMARALDLAVTPWSVIGAGVLSGKYNRDTKPEEGRAKEGAATVPRNLEIASEVIAVSEDLGCTPTQAAISWVQQQRGVIVPLVGARNLAQLEENLGALSVTLGDEHLARLDAVSAIELGFPHDFIGPTGAGAEFIYGGTIDQIDVHRGELA
jgi:aryl-alcohol dehydrogenase-like predicted oxidoreductase